MRTPRALGALLVTTLVSGLLAGATAAPPGAVAAEEPAARATPELQVTTIASGLDHPWDVGQLPDGRLLVTERERARVSLVDGSDVTPVDFPSDTVWVSGETGLMGLAVDPRFEKNRRFYTCQGATRSGGSNDVRVMAWKLKRGAGGTKVARRGVLLKGIPATTGRHGGCRLLVQDNGALVVGTGDAAQGTNPRDLTSLGGKTLRLDRFSGKPWKRNPFSQASNRTKRYVLTYGHRNVQGVAQRKGGALWSVEHGPDVDDEVNRLKKGGDYGWHPGPGYNERVPMTDFSLPGKQYGARWSSGDPTLATSGGNFVYGRQWGAYRGSLVVGALRSQRVLFMKFDKRDRLKTVRVPEELQAYGRVRQAYQLADGDLVLLTDNGGGEDQVLRVSPS